MEKTNKYIKITDEERTTFTEFILEQKNQKYFASRGIQLRNGKYDIANEEGSSDLNFVPGEGYIDIPLDLSEWCDEDFTSQYVSETEFNELWNKIIQSEDLKIEPYKRYDY